MATYPDKVRADERREIRERYRRRRRNPQPGPPPQVRAADLQRYIDHRYGPVLPDDDAGREEAFMMSNQLAHFRDAETRIANWLAGHAPWMPIAQRQALTARVIAKPLRWKADTIARRLNLTAAERELLHITTIGAIDETKEQRKEKRKAKRRAAAIARRRAAGAIPQADRLANSTTARKPWQDAGISRATWYRLRKVAAGET